ncbi:MAG: hypothetical protein JXR48_16090 [Candidatus Delongbacteria bacterium]|nr:hypothetical protein [Candidatus Delongbacteria bacterium]MBN2836479.1 hypothetical protein [Candidatus Delongbacteria bacterium]
MNRSGIKDKEFRVSVVLFSDKNGVSETSKTYNISRETIYRWKRLYKNGYENLANKSKANSPHPGKIKEEIKDEIRKLKSSEPSISLKKIKEKLSLEISLVSISKIIKQNLDKKKKSFELKCLYFGYDKIWNSENFKYIFFLKDIDSKLVWCSVVDKFSIRSVAIFFDYFLSTNRLKKILIMVSNKFDNISSNHLMRTICEKHKISLVNAKTKYSIHQIFNNQLFNLEFDSHLNDSIMKIQTEYNMGLIGINEEITKKLLVPVIRLDRYSIMIREIIEKDNFWLDSETLDKEKFNELFNYLMKTDDLSRVNSMVKLDKLFDLHTMIGFENPESRISIQFKLADLMEKFGLESKAENTLLSVLKLSYKLEKTHISLEALMRLGNLFFVRGLFTKALNYYDQILKNSKESLFTKKNVQIAVMEKCVESYSKTGNFRKALYFVDRLKNLYSEHELYKVDLKKAFVYNIKGNFSHATEILLKALKSNPPLESLTDFYGDLAAYYYFMWNYEESEKFQHLQLQTIDKSKDEQLYARTRARIGIIRSHFTKENIRPYFQEQLDFNNRILSNDKSDKIDIAMAIQRIAAAESTFGNYEKSISLHKKAALICHEVGNYERLCVSYNLISNDYLSLTDIRTALRYRKKELQYLILVKNYQDAYRAKRQIANFYLQLGDFDKAITSYNEMYLEAEKNNNLVYQMESLGKLGIICILTKKEDVHNYLGRYNSFSKKLKMRFFISDSYYLLSKYHEQMDKNFKNRNKIELYYTYSIRYLNNSVINENFLNIYFSYYHFLKTIGKTIKAEKIREKVKRILKSRIIEVAIPDVFKT